MAMSRVYAYHQAKMLDFIALIKIKFSVGGGSQQRMNL